MSEEFTIEEYQFMIKIQKNGCATFIVTPPHVTQPKK